MSCRHMLAVSAMLVCVVSANPAAAQDFTGRYVIESPDGTFTLDVRQDGSATGMGGTAALDGQGGSMFSGRTPDGKSVFWYSGQ